MDTRRGTALLSTNRLLRVMAPAPRRWTPGRTLGPRVVLAGVALVAPLLPAVPASAVAGTCEGRAATHLGTPGDDVLTGTDGDDVMVGLGGDDKISGLLGNDVICGDEGSDRLAGLAGDDRILGGFDSDAGGDVIWPGVGNDYVDAGLDPLTRDDFSVPADTVVYSDLLAAGFPGGIRADLTPVGGLGVVAEPSGTDQVVVTEALSIVGTRTADVLIGSPYLDVLVGRGGADQIDGAGGNDTLVSDFTNTDVDPAADAPDDIDGGSGIDWIALGRAGGTARGGDDMDHLEVHPETDPAVLRGQDGADEILVEAVEDVDVDGGQEAATASSSGSPPRPTGCRWTEAAPGTSPSSTCARRASRRARGSPWTWARGAPDQGAGRSGARPRGHGDRQQGRAVARPRHLRQRGPDHAGGTQPGRRDARGPRLRRRHTRAGRPRPGPGTQRLRERPQGAGTPASAPSGSGAARTRAPAGRVEVWVMDARAIRTNDSNEACRWCLGDRSGTPTSSGDAASLAVRGQQRGRPRAGYETLPSPVPGGTRHRHGGSTGNRRGRIRAEARSRSSLSDSMHVGARRARACAGTGVLVGQSR